MATSLLLLTEIMIALFVHDSFVRPYVGDFLVVILIYCFLRSFFVLKKIPTAIAVLVFAYAVEFSQYFHFAKILGAEHFKILRTILGTSFSWTDILMYTLGIAAVMLVDRDGIEY